MALALISFTPIFANATRNATAITSASFAVQANDLLVCKLGAEDNITTLVTPTNTGTALARAWRLDAEVTSSSRENLAIYTGIAAATESITVSDNPTATGTFYKFGIVEVWRDAAVDAVPAVNATKVGLTGNDAPDSLLTTTAAGSYISWIKGDYAVTSGTQTVRANNTLQEAKRVASAYDCLAAYRSCGAAGNYQIGASSPTFQQWTMIGIEIKQAAAASTDETGFFLGSE